MDLNRSLMLVRVIMRSVYEYGMIIRGGLSAFLVSCNFYASVYSPIMYFNFESLEGAEKELENFLARAKEFAEGSKSFAPYWPGENTEETLRIALSGIIDRKGNDGECFLLIVGLVQETLALARYYKKQ